VKDNDSVIEIGTGWIHFESIVLRLFYDIKATLFDVWDNRHFETIKQFSVELEKVIHKTVDISDDDKQRIAQIVELISQSSSFDDLYQSLGFQYVIDSSGKLQQFQNDSFRLVYSWHVLEHIDEIITPHVVNDFFRILKPGGYSIHKIDISDHLVSFAGLNTVSKKNYLRYNETRWKRYFENKIQYINRIQRPEWLELFKNAGFSFVEENIKVCDINGLDVDSMYSHLTEADIGCESMILVHRKPS
jgi:predicted SAM-dependent methyltransferase